MRWLSLFTVMMLLLRSLAPCCFADGADPSHAPMFISKLLGLEINHHHHMAMGKAEMPSNALNINSGMNIPISSEDWSTFFANFFLVALVRTVWLAILLSIILRLSKYSEKPLFKFLSLLDPPPRKSTLIVFQNS